MPVMRLPFWKKKYLINPRFQLSFVAYNVGVSLLLAAIFYFAIRVFFWKLENFGVIAGLPPSHVFFTFIHEQVRLMNQVFLVILPVVVGLLAVHGILLSHKVAGPLYRFHRHMQQIAEGERGPEPIRFRGSDYFTELGDAYNRQLTRILDKNKAA